MSYLPVKHGLSALFGIPPRLIRAPHTLYTPYRTRPALRHHHGVVDASVMAFGRVRIWLLQPHELTPRLEPTCFEKARMSREMLRL